MLLTGGAASEVTVVGDVGEDISSTLDEFAHFFRKNRFVADEGAEAVRVDGEDDDAIAGRDLGFLNPARYAVANSPNYGTDFYDVAEPTGCNQTSSIPGYCASKGWDAVTGLGTPDVAKLIPDLIAATP